MAGVTRRVEHANHPPGQIQLQPLGGLDDAFRGDRNQLAVEFLRPLGAIHGRNPGEQLRRLGHVPCAAGMHHQLRVGESRHERPGATRVIEVNVGQQHVIHGLRRQPGFGQGLLHMHQRVVVAGIHQRRPSVLLDQVDRRHIRPRISGIHSVDAVPKSLQPLHGHLLEKGRDFIRQRQANNPCASSIFLLCKKRQIGPNRRMITRRETPC